MSVAATNWAWNQGLSGNLLNVLLYLADRAGDNGLSWHGREKIADKCGISVRTVSRLIARLEAKNLVARYRRYKQRSDDDETKVQTSNVVVVMFEGREEDDSGMTNEDLRYSKNKDVVVVTSDTPPCHH
ncbi:helix-turn-helix domain-containing protein [Endozoicomonas lisbonensis]|uniref:DNA-binding Lrp family transcriptional regulator n=1 Tax=Endozoicomonas lisbonensis TaxID=3120522 RepID=A0ABV2SP51_9GAMM